MATIVWLLIFEGLTSSVCASAYIFLR